MTDANISNIVCESNNNMYSEEIYVREESELATLYAAEGLLTGVIAACVPFIPASNLFVAVGTVIGERLLYPSTIGISILIGCLGHWHSTLHSKRPYRLKILIILLLVLYSYLSILRVDDWKSRDSLYLSDSRKYSGSAKVMHTVGSVHHSRGEYLIALQWYERSLSVFDDNALTDYCIAHVYISLRHINKAYERFNKIIRGHWNGFGEFNRWLILVDYGYIQALLGNLEYGKSLLREGLSLMSDCAYGQNTLAWIYYLNGEYQLSINSLQIGMKIGKVDERVKLMSNIAAVCITSGELYLAGEILKEALELEGGKMSVHLYHNLKVLDLLTQESVDCPPQTLCRPMDIHPAEIYTWKGSLEALTQHTHTLPNGPWFTLFYSHSP
eukprot:GHVR01155058.1.p1 GENE.GHVR01155058.1~~GHVR01155058.1.p1  ORF type:complete len:385 (-),score=71.52 GHVR01155058.1:84-1238(-)